MRGRLLGPIAGLAICSALLAPAAARADHLWIAFANGGAARYPLAGGVPASQPDLQIAGVSAPIAVARDGTLYATVPLRDCYGVESIEAFPAGQTQPQRTITLTAHGGDCTLATALAVGEDGYLYAGYISEYSSARGLSKTGPPIGVQIFGPRAHGGPPLNTIKIHDALGGPLALVVAPRGDLYVSHLMASFDRVRTAIRRFGQPKTSATLLGTLLLGREFAGGVAVSDEGEHLYALGIDSPASSIYVFRYDAVTGDKPIREMTLGAYVGTSLSLDGGYAYSESYGNDPFVTAYPQGASGSPQPLFVDDFRGIGVPLQVAAAP